MIIHAKKQLDRLLDLQPIWVALRSMMPLIIPTLLLEEVIIDMDKYSYLQMVRLITKMIFAEWWHKILR